MVMVHMVPPAELEDGLISLDTLRNQVQAKSNVSDILTEQDYEMLDQLRQTIDISLKCANDKMESGLSTPCYTCRMHAVKAMMVYLAVHDIDFVASSI